MSHILSSFLHRQNTIASILFNTNRVSDTAKNLAIKPQKVYNAKNRFLYGHHQFDEANCKATMDFQTHCNGYLQNIHRTHTDAEATPELSLFPHLQTFLEKLFVAHFDRDTIRLTQEPRGRNQIGRPDFIVSVNAARQRYRLPRDSQDWQIHSAQADIRNHPNIEQHITPMHYRPYDRRWTYYTGQASGFHSRPGAEVMRHMRKENLALCVCRIVKSPMWQNVLITDKITDKSYISNRTSESTYMFSLYLYPNPEELGVSTEPSLNFQPAFLTALSEALALAQIEPFNLPEGISPEEILAYIYAILYSPTYRQRYYDFLKYDFPRIPLPPDIAQFRTLTALGQRLMDWHLLREVQIPVMHRFEGEGDGVVGKVRYAEGQVWINPTQYFTDVPIEVWEYEIGAYQICEKWLRDRKGKVLRHEDVRQYRAILVAIAETIEIMAEIDQVLW